MEKQQKYKLDAHVRSNDEALADTVKDRARRSNRTITKEIERALRIAYKLGAGDDRPA